MNKNFLYAIVLGAFLTSCGADQKIVDQMANELCTAMNKYDEKDPMTMLSAAEDMMKIADNKTYESVTESQLKDAMTKMCPDGAKKFDNLANSK
ncbi:MAG: hypothetical protein K2X86_08560 [Cytophagaceae bacterium]|nr:hypothetical protein [Cytophagaceae bacterium]